MMLDGELDAYADDVTVTAYSSIIGFTGELYEAAKEFSGEKMDAAIRGHYPAELADKLVAKDHYGEVYDDPYTVEGSEIGAIDAGFILFASKVDWDESTLAIDWLDERSLGLDMFFPSQDFVSSEFPDPSYKLRFSGLKFEARRIELLLPTAQLKIRGEIPTLRSIGRPQKWDWDGAMAHVVSQAQTPDGLPTGHGAQAKIEAMVATWFEAETGDSPATSQIRKRASRIIEMIEGSKKGLKD